MTRSVDLRRVVEVARGATAAELWFSTRAWLVAPAVEGALRLLGVRRTLRAIAQVRRPGLLGPRRASAVAVDAGERWVARAYAVHALGGLCLPRASIQHLLHRLDGTPSRLVIGVRPSRGVGDPGPVGIEAHAWVAASEGALDGGLDEDGFAVVLVVDDAGIQAAA